MPLPLFFFISPEVRHSRLCYLACWIFSGAHVIFDYCHTISDDPCNILSLESEAWGDNVTSLRFLFYNVTKSELKSKFRVPNSRFLNNTMLENTVSFTETIKYKDICKKKD